MTRTTGPASIAGRKRYMLLLEDIGDCPSARAGLPSGRRLAYLLKFALRACGLRCITVEERTPALQIDGRNDATPPERRQGSQDRQLTQQETT